MSVFTIANVSSGSVMIGDRNVLAGGTLSVDFISQQALAALNAGLISISPVFTHAPTVTDLAAPTGTEVENNTGGTGSASTLKVIRSDSTANCSQDTEDNLTTLFDILTQLIADVTAIHTVVVRTNTDVANLQGGSISRQSSVYNY